MTVQKNLFATSKNLGIPQPIYLTPQPIYLTQPRCWWPHHKGATSAWVPHTRALLLESPVETLLKSKGSELPKIWTFKTRNTKSILKIQTGTDLALIPTSVSTLNPINYRINTNVPSSAEIIKRNLAADKMNWSAIS